eukprot:3663120-Prymnesium_polylepis.1
MGRRPSRCTRWRVGWGPRQRPGRHTRHRARRRSARARRVRVSTCELQQHRRRQILVGGWR